MKLKIYFELVLNRKNLFCTFLLGSDTGPIQLDRNHPHRVIHTCLVVKITSIPQGGDKGFLCPR